MGKQWTDHDIETLKSMAGKCHVEEIQQALNRSKPSICKKASQLKISLLISSDEWTEQEITKLKKLSEHYSAEYIGKQLNKSANIVKQQANRLGICLKQGLWSEDEVSLLDIWAGELPIEVIAKRLNRSVKAVRQKAYSLGIDLTLELDNFSARTLAKMLGVHRNTICEWVKDGKLKTTRIGNDSKSVYRISRKAFMRFYQQYNKQIITLQRIDPEKLEYVFNG